jgi:hypothetical protein
MQKEETYSYKGWLNSDSFWKRSLAVVGYSFVGTFIIYGLIALATLLGVFTVAFWGALLNF